MKSIIIGLAVALATTTAAFAMDPAKTMNTTLGKILVGENGMTLYTFDKDPSGTATSMCTGKCIANWPPFLTGQGAMAEGQWTIVNVTDKDGMATKMWAYDGKPLYYYVGDSHPGDVTGNGVGNVWHVVHAQ